MQIVQELGRSVSSHRRAVNPTCTIQALALYIGDSILKNIGNLFD